MSYIIGGLIALSMILISVIYINRSNAKQTQERLKKAQQEADRREDATLIIFDKNIDGIHDKIFNSDDEAFVYLSGKSNGGN